MKIDLILPQDVPIKLGGTRTRGELTKAIIALSPKDVIRVQFENVRALNSSQCNIYQCLRKSRRIAQELNGYKIKTARQGLTLYIGKERTNDN